MRTGFPPSIKRAVIAREQEQCARCAAPGTDIHHRRPRGMGGSNNPITNGPTSAILLCRTCHQWVESNRSLATDQGWLVPSRVDPGIVPIWRHGQWWLLEADRWQPTNLNPPF